MKCIKISDLIVVCACVTEVEKVKSGQNTVNKLVDAATLNMKLVTSLIVTFTTTGSFCELSLTRV